MEEKAKSIIKPLIMIAALIFLALYFWKKPESIEDYFSYVGYSITAVTVLFIIYEKWLWKLNPKNKQLILKKNYDGTITYKYKNNQAERKNIEIEINQTWLTVDITGKTDINSSSTVSGTIIHEFGKNILYYTYITNPNANTERKNPIQYGTCRMVLENSNSTLKGKYWTSEKTIGDIEWVEKSK